MCLDDLRAHIAVAGHGVGNGLVRRLRPLLSEGLLGDRRDDGRDAIVHPRRAAQTSIDGLQRAPGVVERVRGEAIRALQRRPEAVHGV